LAELEHKSMMTNKTLEGAAWQGAATEHIDLSSLNFTD
jgi:multimeric flavodoxin WrbA